MEKLIDAILQHPKTTAIGGALLVITIGAAFGLVTKENADMAIKILTAAGFLIARDGNKSDRD